MFIHETTYRVRYADTDQMGFMYYGNYARLYEIGRVEAMRSIDFSYKKMEEGGVIMPVYENTSRYIQPALYDENLTIITKISNLPAARIVFEYEIMNTANTLIHTGKTTLVFLKKENNRLTIAPKELLEKLKVFFR